MKRSKAGTGRERFVSTTLELIAEEGGSLDVNLRQISRRMGCAHTNVYNYFGSYQELLWDAFRRTLRLYGDAVIVGVDASLPAHTYLLRVIANLAAFPEDNPGLYRFLASDRFPTPEVPAGILETATQMKIWLGSVFEAAAGPATSPGAARDAADIVLAYIDGETLNLINGRSIPSEDLRGRIEGNSLRLFALLTGGEGDAVRGVPPQPSHIFGRG